MKYILLVLITLVFGCANTARSPQSLNWFGNIAYDQMQYEVAKENYQSAFTLAKSLNDKKFQSIAMYGLARTNGRLCSFSDAEHLLKQSINIRNELFSIDNAKKAQYIFELGRIYIVQEKWEMALIQYEIAFSMLYEFDMKRTDPIGFSNLLKEYSQALEKMYSEKAQLVSSEIIELVNSNPNNKVSYISNMYSKSCNKPFKQDQVTIVFRPELTDT